MTLFTFIGESLSEIVGFTKTIRVFFVVAILGIVDFVLTHIQHLAICIDAINSVLVFVISIGNSAIVGFINAFFPLSEFFDLAGKYIAIAVCLAGIKWLFKLIPFFG